MNKLVGMMLAGLALMMVTGCSDEGKVIQGRVIAFDAAKGQMTFIEDKSTEKGKPEYTLLPPVVFNMPEDKNERGADPAVGQRMKLDTDKNQIVIFNKSTQAFEEIAYQLIEKKSNVGKEDPLVKGKKFPIVDRNAKTVQIYSSRLKTWVSFSLPLEYFSLPDETWAAGDEVRIYYKEKGKALRYMNITKTDIFKK